MNEISIYDDKLTENVVMLELKKLSVSFPDLKGEFFTVLSERLVKNGFTDSRLKDAIGFVIDNCTYKKPSIANIISYDKTVKLYSHNDVCNEVYKGNTFDDFKIIERNGKKFWIKKTDAEQYGL